MEPPTSLRLKKRRRPYLNCHRVVWSRAGWVRKNEPFMKKKEFFQPVLSIMLLISSRMKMMPISAKNFPNYPELICWKRSEKSCTATFIGIDPEIKFLSRNSVLFARKVIKFVFFFIKIVCFFIKNIDIFLKSCIIALSLIFAGWVRLHNTLLHHPLFAYFPQYPTASILLYSQKKILDRQVRTLLILNDQNKRFMILCAGSARNRRPR